MKDNWISQLKVVNESLAMAERNLMNWAKNVEGLKTDKKVLEEMIAEYEKGVKK